MVSVTLPVQVDKEAKRSLCEVDGKSGGGGVEGSDFSLMFLFSFSFVTSPLAKPPVDTMDLPTYLPNLRQPFISRRSLSTDR